MKYIKLFFIAIGMIVKYTIQAIRDADKYNKDMKKALNYARENGIIISYKRN